MGKIRTTMRLILRWLYDDGVLERFPDAYAQLRGPDQARQASEAAVRELLREGLITGDGKLTPDGRRATEAMIAALKFAADMERAVQEEEGKGTRF